MGKIYNDREEFDNWKFVYNSMILITFTLIIILVFLLIVLVCKRLVLDKRAADPEQILLVQEKVVTNMYYRCLNYNYKISGPIK